MLATETHMPTEIDFRRASEFLWNETKGLIFSASFIKKDGTMRRMVCRTGVKKYLKGGSLPYDAKLRLLLPVFDMQKGEYRIVNLASLVGFNIHGTTFLVA